MQTTRYDNYKVPEIEVFMVNVLEKKGEIKPSFDLKLGYRYPEVEEIIKMDSSKTIDFLENLCNMGILKKEIYDMELRCPTCNSSNISVNYICPYCASFSIQRTLLIEHKVCGYLGTSQRESSVCPKCGKKILEGEYRDAGSIYECKSCKKQIETPFVSHWCRECALKFSFENTIYQPKHVYSATELTKKEIEAGILYIHQVVNVFNQQGFTRDMNTKVIGESGIDQVFDLAFNGFGVKYYVDILFSLTSLSESDIIKEYGKILDTKVNSCVIVLPGLSDAANKFVKSYNMNVIEATKPEVAISKLQSDLGPKVFALKANVISKTEVSEKLKEKDKGIFFRRKE